MCSDSAMAWSDLLGGLAQAALDLGEVRVGDPDHPRELPHGELRELALAADELAERR